MFLLLVLLISARSGSVRLASQLVLVLVPVISVLALVLVPVSKLALALVLVLVLILATVLVLVFLYMYSYLFLFQCLPVLFSTRTRTSMVGIVGFALVAMRRGEGHNVYNIYNLRGASA